jgi:hypothetical protein
MCLVSLLLLSLKWDAAVVVIELHEFVHQSHELPALLAAERRYDLVLRSIHGLLNS